MNIRAVKDSVPTELPEGLEVLEKKEDKAEAISLYDLDEL